MSPSEEKICPFCDTAFPCAARTGRPCWCQEFPPLANLEAGLDCRCPGCLDEAIQKNVKSPLASQKSRKGFTLVELLVVSAILALLAGILLPALVRGKAAAENAKCLGNLRQLGLAGQMYWDDHRGDCFRASYTSVSNGLYWFGWLSGGAESEREFDARPGKLFPYLQGRGVEVCPSLDQAGAFFKRKATGAAYGYGYNLNLSPPLHQPPKNIQRLARPGDTAFLADAAQINDFLHPASADHPLLEEYYFINSDPVYPNGHFRHQQKANVVFCDGHVGGEKPVEGSLSPRLPQARVGSLRPAILLVP